jgi:hypothetical protein
MDGSKLRHELPGDRKPSFEQRRYRSEYYYGFDPFHHTRIERGRHLYVASARVRLRGVQRLHKFPEIHGDCECAACFGHYDRC